MSAFGPYVGYNHFQLPFLLHGEQFGNYLLSSERHLAQTKASPVDFSLSKRKILKTNSEYQRLHLERTDRASTAICVFFFNYLVSCVHNYYRKFIIYRNIEICDCRESEQ